jgi:hypothetical protein
MKASTMTRHLCVLLLAALLSACAGFGDGVRVISYDSGERWLNPNFHIIEHPFTDEGTARAKARADSLCASQQRRAVQSERACSLEKCTTHYQCVTAADAKSYGL